MSELTITNFRSSTKVTVPAKLCGSMRPGDRAGCAAPCVPGPRYALTLTCKFEGCQIDTGRA
eukprot:scaffold99105_cov60-Phaeocystis_antarctica.AAC.8